MPRPTTTPIVYLVDDEPDVLGSLQFLLETDGFDVRTFRSGAALFNAIATDEVDCLVIDHKMPAMSGIELANRLRNCATDGGCEGWAWGMVAHQCAACGLIFSGLRGPVGDAARLAHCGEACHMGGARAQAEAMAIRTRRTEMRH